MAISMKKKKYLRKLISCVLVAALILTTIPVAFAAPYNGTEGPVVEIKMSPIDRMEMLKQMKAENQGSDKFIVKHKDDNFNYQELELQNITTELILDINSEYNRIMEYGLNKINTQSVFLRGAFPKKTEEATITKAETIEFRKSGGFHPFKGGF